MRSMTGSFGARILALPVFLVATTAFANAAPQETAAKEGRETERSAGTAVRDSWVTLKVHSQFVPEDALEGSDIDVNTKSGVVTLSGTVVSQAGKARALEIAKSTDGVKSVNDRLRIARADADRPTARDNDREDAGEAGRTAREAGREASEEAREAGRSTRDAGREARDETRDAGRTARDTATGTTGTSISDGWIKSKIAAQFVTENALDDSDININVRRGVVTLNGAVPTAAGRTRAEAIVKSTDGVRSVNNRLKVASDKK